MKKNYNCFSSTSIEMLFELIQHQKDKKKTKQTNKILPPTLIARINGSDGIYFVCEEGKRANT